MSYKDYIGKTVRMEILDENNLTDEGAIDYKNVVVKDVDDTKANTITYAENNVEYTVPLYLINQIKIINEGGGGEDVTPNVHPNQKRVRGGAGQDASEKQDVNKTFDRICVFTNQNTYSSGK